MQAASVKTLWHKVRDFLHLDDLSPGVRRIIVGIVGGLFVLIGIAMIVLPGPAFIVIPAGLALLATEFEWAKKLARKAKRGFVAARRKVSARRHRGSGKPK